jgi:hypothetical protein
MTVAFFCIYSATVVDRRYILNHVGIAKIPHSNPERVASIQPRVGAAAPTLGTLRQKANPVRVESNV